MKDALGHGSNAHGIGVERAVKRPPGSLPVRLEKLRDDTRVHDVFMEKDPGSPPTYWVYLKPGWISPEMESGTIHEDTVADVMKKFKNVRREEK